MKPKFRSNPYLRAAKRVSSRLPHAAGFGLALCVVGLSPSARATSQTWDGGAGGTGTTLQTLANWSGDTTAPTSGETATFSNTNGTGGNLSLTYDNTFTGGSNGVSFSVAGLHTGTLTIDPGTNTTSLRVKDITVDASAGALTFGNGDASLFNLTFGSGNAGFTTNALTNNSSGTTVTFKSDVRFANGGASAATVRAITFDGAGNWQVDNVFKPTQSAAQGAFALTKKGTGSLTLNANNTGNNANNVATGLQSITIEQGAVLAGATGALGGGGSTAGTGGVTLGLTGSNNASLLNTGAFTQSNAITLASGNNGTLTIGGNHATGTSAYTGNITLNSNVVLSAASGGQVNFTTGVISGGGNVTFSGGGTIALSGTNTYTGTTTIENGVVRATGAAALGNATSVIALGNATSISSNLNSTLRLNGATTIARDITVGASNSATTGTYSIDTDNGATAVGVSGVVTLNQNLTVSGTTTGGFTLSGNITSGSSSARTVAFAGNSNGVLAASGVIGGGTGTIALGKSGAATLTLSGNNSYTGGTTISGGIINAQNNNAFGASGVVNQASGGRNSGIQLQGGITLPGTVTFLTSNDGTSGATVAYAINNVSGNNTINGAINLTTGGGGSIFQSDSGALTLAGDISIAAGQSSRGIILQGASTAANTVSGVVSDLSPAAINSVIKKGTGTWALSGTNTYTGATTISGGTLSVGSLANGGGSSNIGQSTSAAANLVFDGGTLKYTGATVVTDREFTINAGKTAVIETDNGLTLVGATGTSTNGALTKTGTGVLTLSGASTYTGATTVSAGTLLVNGSLGNTAVAVNAGTLGGTGTIAGSVSVGTATYAPGASPGSLEIAGNLTLSSETTTSIELGGTAFTLNGTEEYDRTKLTGSTSTLTLAGTLAVSLFGGFTPDDGQAFGIFQLGSGATLTGIFTGLGEGAFVGTFGGKDFYITYEGDFGDTGPVATFGGNDIVLYSIPEPHVAALGGLAALMLLRRRQR